jgi:hypothetical protein
LQYGKDNKNLPENTFIWNHTGDKEKRKRGERKMLAALFPLFFFLFFAHSKILTTFVP